MLANGRMAYAFHGSTTTNSCVQLIIHVYGSPTAPFNVYLRFVAFEEFRLVAARTGDDEVSLIDLADRFYTPRSIDS